MPVSGKAIALLALPALIFVSPANELLVRSFAVDAYEADGPSMEPTLLHGDRFVVDRGAYGLFLPASERAALTWGQPAAGDVVVIRSPSDGIDIIKRVVAVGGDEVELRADEVFVNGESLRRRPWRTEGQQRTALEGVGQREWVVQVDALSPPSDFGPEMIPPGYLFVLGDHRDRSNDSRHIGAVPLDHVIGRAVGLYWSAGAEGLRADRVGMVLP